MSRNAAVEFREATIADADAIADLHTASWRATYRAFLPADYLNGPLASEQRSRWRGILPALGSEDVVQLAVADGTGLAGFISAYSRPGDGAKGALIDNLHVAAAWKGEGIGRALMRTAAARLQATGHSFAWLTVIDGNQGSVAFYERMGGRRTDRFVAPLRGYDVPQIRYEWHDLGALAHAS